MEEEVKMFSDYTNKSMQYRRCEVPHLKAHFSTTAFLDLGLEIVKVLLKKNVLPLVLPHSLML